MSRKNTIILAIKRYMLERSIPSEKEFCARVPIPYSTYTRLKRNSFADMSLEVLSAINRIVKFTDEELSQIVRVKNKYDRDVRGMRFLK